MSKGVLFMKANITNLFYVKRAKANKDGLVPIFQRITINGKRIERSTGKYIDNSLWLTEAAKMKGKSEEARSINSYLVQLLQEVVDAEKDITINRKVVNFLSMKDKLIGKDENERTFIPIFQEHNDRILALVETKEYAIGTWKNFGNTLKHFKTFLLKKYRKDDILIEEIDYALLSDFDFYLRTKSIKCNNNAVIKHIKQLYKIYNICLNNEWVYKNPFKKFKPKTTAVDRGYLNFTEVKLLIDNQELNPKLELVRDAFVFSCYTGLAYIDAYNLKRSNITIGIDGDKWIFINRAKTEAPSHIPILPIAHELLQKYKDDPRTINSGKALPLISNQKMNKYLKELAAACKITKRLTFHLARHTFATTITLTNGVPLESVGKMLGHRSIKSTQIYARVLDDKLSDDMKTLKQKLK